MATTMRKLSRLAATGRAAASFSNSATARRQLILQTALYSSRSNTFSYASQSHRFSSHDRVTGGLKCVGCNMSFSTAASAARDLDEKESPQSNKSYIPNDVVLYQYQACPFCNKVKGNDDL